MSLRKRRGELRGDILGEVMRLLPAPSLGGSSSKCMCSLKVRMQGSNSGALSSLDDMVMLRLKQPYFSSFWVTLPTIPSVSLSQLEAMPCRLMFCVLDRNKCVRLVYSKCVHALLCSLASSVSLGFRQCSRIILSRSVPLTHWEQSPSVQSHLLPENRKKEKPHSLSLSITTPLSVFLFLGKMREERLSVSPTQT